MRNTLEIVVAFMLALGASNTWAQPSSAPPPVNSWTIGADLAPGNWVHIGGDTATEQQKKDAWVNLFVGYKPLGSFGGEARFQKFGAQSTLGSSDGMPISWGVNATPKIISSAPILNGPVAYTVESSAKFSRIDILGNYNRGFRGGWISAFGGVPILKMEGTEAISREQNFLLYARLPNSTLDTKGNREDYAYSSSAASKATMFGLAGGVEGAYCLISNLVLEGRFGLAVFPWGSANLDGQFSATKDIYLVNVAGGVNATPISTLAHLNWAPTALPYSDTAKQTVTAVDVKVGLKWKIKIGERATLNMGMAISRSSLSNLPTTAGYVIGDPYAVGKGKFVLRTTTVSMWAPMATIGVWF